MRSWLAAVTLLQALVAAPVQADPGHGAPVLLAQARRRLLPPLTLGAPPADARLTAPADWGQCITEEERRAVTPGQRWKAFRRSAVPFPPLLYLSQDRTFTEALLLYWSSTNVEDRTKLRMLFPAFVWSCTPRSRTLVTPLFGHRDDAEGRAGFIGPYYYRRDRHAQSDVLFPLFARVVDREGSTITALNFYHHRNPRGTHGAVVPLAFWGSYRDGGHYALVPPLVFHAGDRETSTTVVTPFYLKRHRVTGDFDAGLVPLYFGGRHGRDYYHLVLPPLLAHWGNDRYAGTQVLNTFVRVDRRSGDWLFLVFPAAFGFRHGRTSAVVSPLVTHVSTPGGSTTVVPPFYLHRDRRSLHVGAFPLFFHGHRRGRSSYTHVPPLLFFDARDRRGAVTWALNAYYSRAYLRDGAVDPRDWDAGVIPLWFQGRAQQRRYLFVPPLLLFDWENEAAGTRTTIFPLGYRIRDHRSRSLGVVPFFFAHESGPAHFWLAPALLSAHWGDAEGSTTIVGPFFRRRSATAIHRGLVPLFFQGHTATTRYTVVPLLPFWYQREADRRLLIVGPLFHSRDRDGYDAGFVPLLFTGRAGPRRYTAVPPLMLYDWSDEAAGTRTTLFPVGYRHRHPGGWHFGLVPLVFASAHGVSHQVSIPPLLTFHWGDGVTERTIAAGLFYRFRGPGSRHHGLFPLYLAGERDPDHPDGPASYRLIAPPLYVHRWSPASETTLFLQTWSHRARDGEWHGGSFPFYLGGRIPASDTYYDIVLPPLFVRFGGDHGRYAYLLAGPVYYGRYRNRRQFGVFPFYFGGRNLGDGTHRYDYVLPPFFMRWEDRGERRFNVGPFYDRVTATARETMLMPFYFGGYDLARGSFHHVFIPFGAHWGDRDRRSTVILSGYYSRGRDGYDLGLAPLLFHGRRHDGRHYTHLAPLVWHWGSRHAEGTVVFPFAFAYRHRRSYARAITPLFYQWGNRRAHTSLLVPLAYLEREGRSSLFLSPLVVSHIDAPARQQRLVVFPLYWRFASPDSTVNVAFPLWWDFQQHRRATRLSILLPIGFRRDARDETTSMFLNVVYTRGKGRFAAAWSFHFFPLFDLSSFNPDHFKWQVLMGLLGRERQGGQARWRLVYVWTDPG